MSTSSNSQRQSVLKTTRNMVGIALLMFGFGYLLVPLYNVLCKQLGINGKTDGYQQAYVGQVDKSRTIVVEFLATNNDGLHWSFFPATHQIKLHPGEMKRVAYFAKNDTDHAMSVQAIPSVSPGIAAKYLKKTECFCFTQQTLGAHEGRDMPLLFHLDPEIPKYVKRISLSYTLFDVSNFQSNNSNNKPQGRLS